MSVLCSKCCSFLDEKKEAQLLAIGLLVLRVYAGSMMLFGHGIGKLMSFSENSARFPDPLGVGSPLSLTMAIFAEVLCSAAVIFGFFTRLAAIPLIVTMLVAAFVIHGDDPWAKKEFALMHLLPYLTIALTGPGCFSLDARCKAKAKNAE